MNWPGNVCLHKLVYSKVPNDAAKLMLMRMLMMMLTSTTAS